MFKHRSRQIGLLLAIVPVSFTLLLASGCNRDPNVRKHKYLESGKRYEKDGKYKEAVIQFSNALKVDHNFSDAHYELGKTYLQMGSMKAGYGELMRTVDLDPKNVQARNDLASLYLAGNAPDRAAEQVKAVLAIDPKNGDAYSLLSGLSAQKGDVAGALENIKKALELNPNKASFHTALALLENSNPASSGTAEQELQKAISLDPKDIRAQLVLAAMLEKKGDKQGAEQHYLAGIQAAPKDLRSRSALAGLYLRSGDKAKGEATLRQAATDLSDNMDASELLKEFYFREGQVDTAESVFADLTAKNPKSFPIKMTYANILATKQEFAKVKPISEELNKTNGKMPQVLVLKAALLATDSKIDEAFNVLQDGAKNNPDNEQIQVALAKISLLKRDFGTAEASYRAAEKLAPNDMEIQAGLGQVALARNDANLLATVADKTIQMHPDAGQGYLWRGMAEAGLKQFDKADKDLQTAIAKSPESAAPYIQLAQLRFGQQHIPEGMALMEKALEKEPNATMALQGIVMGDMSLKQPEKALARVQQQIVKSPKNPSFYEILSEIQLNMKDSNGARDNAKKAMDLDPNDRRAVALYATAVGIMGNTDEAIRTWEKWTSAHPKDGDALSMLAIAYEQKGDTAKATDYYKRTLLINPNEAMAANNLAYLMATSGQNIDVALSYAQTARRVMPNSPDTADTLAWVYYYKGTYYSARDLLEGASKQSPDNAAIHYHLGMTYSKMGRKADAITQLKKAVSLGADTPAGKDAAKALSTLG